MSGSTDAGRPSTLRPYITLQVSSLESLRCIRCLVRYTALTALHALVALCCAPE